MRIPRPLRGLLTGLVSLVVFASAAVTFTAGESTPAGASSTPVVVQVAGDDDGRFDRGFDGDGGRFFGGRDGDDGR